MKSQVESNESLRTILSFEDTYSRNHFLVLQEQAEDKIYMITEYPSYLNEEYKSILNEVRTRGKLNDNQVRQLFSEKMSQCMNIQEKKYGNSFVECITNSSIDDSFVIYAQ